MNTNLRFAHGMELFKENEVGTKNMANEFCGGNVTIMFNKLGDKIIHDKGLRYLDKIVTDRV